VPPEVDTACPWCSRPYGALSAPEPAAQLQVEQTAAPDAAQLRRALLRAAPAIAFYVLGMLVASAVWAAFVWAG
jgi:hypothetical protein